MTHPWQFGPLLGFDLETTGVDRFNDVPVSYAFVEFKDGNNIGGGSTLVNPGRPIPPGAIAVHGITDERAALEGQPLEDAIGEIVAGLLAASRDQTPIVGANLPYDLSMVEACAQRELGFGLLEAGFNAPVVDVLVIDKTYAKFRKGKRTLDVLCEIYGVSIDGAHDAAVDAAAAVEVAIAQVAFFSTTANHRSKGPLPTLDSLSVAELHQLQIGWHRTWAEEFSSWLVSEGKSGLSPDEMVWPLATVDSH